MQLTGITRALTFSPFQHAENDRLILEQTAAVLRRRGCSIRIISEQDVGQEPLGSPVVFSMCQGFRANAVLAQQMARGLLVINHPQSVQRCYRENLYPFLGPDCQLVPPTALLRTDRPDLLPRGMVEAGPVWIKRGDVHATQQGDVVRAESLQQCQQVLADFRQRGIGRAAVQQHLEGQVVKFYGVVGSSFFRFYAEDDHKVMPVGFSLARPAIESVVRRMGLEIYGGDAVLSPEGDVTLIDVNDWPSFACFREDASEAIAQHILQRAMGHTQRVVARRRRGPGIQAQR